MISIHENVLLKVISFYKTEIKNHVNQVEKELDNFIKDPTKIVKRKAVKIILTADQKKYLIFLKKNLSDIVLANTSSINVYKTKISTDIFKFI